jgi:hypothetical protein
MAMFAPTKQSLIIGDNCRCKAGRCIVALLCVFTLVYTRASIAADSEPTYFIFHGERKNLTLDLENIAVQTTSASAKTTAALNAVPRGLQVNGFAPSDVIAQPASGWAVLNARNALAVSAAQAQRTLGAAVVPSKAAAIHAVISSVLASGDPSIEFVSPVFRDINGDPVVLTSRLLIGFRPNLSLAERSRLLAAVPEGAWPEITALPQPHDELWQIKTRDGFVMLVRANALAQTPGVAYAEPDMMVTWHAGLLPSDPGFSDSWGLRNFGQSGGLVGFDLKATSAWDTTVGSASMIVLVLDDGVQQNHPDINQIAGKDFTSDAAKNPTGGPVGTNDNHGTAVAGCISERMNNGLGTTGIAPGVKIASARFATNGQPDGSFTTFDSWIVNALNWGLSIGARVSNNSNGTNVPSSAVESAYNSTRANGMTHFASAGNNGTSSVTFPASIAAVNAVGAATRFGSRASFSQYGPGLKFMAPGQAILTTDRTGQAGFVSTDYVIINGTSLASPYAAGVAALIISQQPGITPDQVEAMMTSTCTDMGPVGYDTGFGYGMINAFAAVTAPVPGPPPSANLANISTRASVQTGSNVSIAGFIISGTDPKKVLIRAIGPSLAAFGITNALQDPTLELHSGNSLLISDDNWQSAANSGEIPATYQPPNARESAILATLQPGSYTAIMAGSSASTGVGLVEVYDFDDSVDSKLSNVSTRGFVGTGNDVMIGGFIAAGGNGRAEVVIRALGPSLAQFGISNFLADPTVAIYNSNGAVVSSNDNWKTSQQAAIQGTGLAPANDFESAVLLTLPVGNYTAVVRGKNSSTGVALVEVYRR